MEAFEELRLELESYFDAVQLKLQRLHLTMRGHRTKETASKDSEATNMLAAEPIALVDYRHHRSKEEQVELGRTMERKFLGNVSSTRGVDIRLHGRWMELSTRTGDETTLRAVQVQRAANARFSEFQMDSGAAFHPGGNFRVAWDVLGLFFLSMDAVMLPLSLAFNINMGWDDLGGVMQGILFWTGLVYWCSDIVINFNTAVFYQGRLVDTRREIAYHYLRTWFFFDLGLITLDIVSVSTEWSAAGDLSTLRSLRVVRALRLLRLLKVSKLKTIIQEMVASTGRSGIVFMLAIVNTAIMIMFMIHVMSCVWYGIAQTSINSGQVSWIDMSMARDVSQFTQYMHSLRYVINAPSPPLVAPDNLLELSMDTVANILGLMILGSAVSKISQALADMRANSESDDRQRREIRLYLNGQNAPFELVSRIMKFVDYRLEKMNNITFDGSLISKTLQTELYVNQRNIYLIQLPIFSLAQAVYPDVFADLCACLNKDVFEKFEPVYVQGSWARGMVMTLSGTFTYTEGDNGSTSVEGTAWFEEASLYVDSMLHNSSLATKTFGETFRLSGEDLVQCLVNSPGCTRMFLEYARDFVANLTRGKEEPFIRETQMKAGERACLANLHYQELYQDPKKKLQHIATAAWVKGEQLPPPLHTEDFAPRKSVKRGSMINAPIGITLVGAGGGRRDSKDSGSWLLRRQDSASSAYESIRSQASAGSGAEEDFGLEALIQDFMTDETSPKEDEPGENEEESVRGLRTGDDSTLASRVVSAIPELDKRFGPYIIFDQEAERGRAESSCISLLALLGKHYDIFTLPQQARGKLLHRQWQELLEIVDWIAPTKEQVRGVLVLLAIRGIVKSKAVTRQIPKQHRRPERAITFLMECCQQVVPSASHLTNNAMQVVRSALVVHETFNLAQMLQGENVPGSVVKLKELIRVEGEEALRNYMLFLLGFMSGVSGGEGSRFMNAKNAEGFIAGVRMLQQLTSSTPRGIYWGFLQARAEALEIPRQSAEDFALVRLACLARVQDAKAYVQLRSAWEGLSVRERDLLLDHFLADGIEQRAYVLEFLPACVQNAQQNKVIGLSLLLEVLVDIICNLHPATAGTSAPDDMKIVPCNLSDLAEFVQIVKNRFIFRTCISRSRLRWLGDHLTLEMTGGNWARLNEADSDTTALANTIKEISDQQRELETRLHRNEWPHKLQRVIC